MLFRSDRDKKGKIYDEIEMPKEMPTAFVCNCDLVAYRLIRQLEAQGLRVPEDVSVVGFDDYIYSVLSTPQLTTFRVDIEKMAAVCVDSMIGKLNNPAYQMGRHIISGNIIKRDSVTECKIN